MTIRLFRTWRGPQRQYHQDVQTYHPQLSKPLMDNSHNCFMRMCVLALVLLLPGCTLHKSELDETLKWMDNTYNAHENVSGAYGHGRSAWFAPDKGPNGERIEALANGMTQSFTYRGCDLFLKLDQDPNENEATEIHQTGKVDFNLRDIDPTSIKIRVGCRLGDFSCDADADGQKSIVAETCDHATMNFKTRNEGGLINEDWHSIFLKLSGPQHDSHKVGKTNSAYFVFDDPDYAKRFAKAFSHAVELCGGKASPF